MRIQAWLEPYQCRVSGNINAFLSLVLRRQIVHFLLLAHVAKATSTVLQSGADAAEATGTILGMEILKQSRDFITQGCNDVKKAGSL